MAPIRNIYEQESGSIARTQGNFRSRKVNRGTPKKKAMGGKKETRPIFIKKGTTDTYRYGHTRA